jgi:hypothetical protein
MPVAHESYLLSKMLFVSVCSALWLTCMRVNFTHAVVDFMQN